MKTVEELLMEFIAKHASHWICDEDEFDKDLNRIIEASKLTRPVVTEGAKERNEIEVLYQLTEKHIDEDINWDAYKNEVIIASNKSDAARGDVEQFASDSFQHGWMAAKEYFMSSQMGNE